MSLDKIANDAHLYTDIQGLEQLHAQYKKDPDSVKKQVSQQFESLFVQMVMKSMREANKSFSSDLLGSDDMDFYQEMFDKQLSLSLSNHGLGLAKMIEQNMDAQMGKSMMDMTPSPNNQPILSMNLTPRTLTETSEPSTTAELNAAPINTSTQTQTPTTSRFDSPKSFVQGIWAAAKKAASVIGTPASVLVAQAALETDWGKKALNHNLFNIKADPQWKKATTSVATLENKNGVLVKEKSNFRAYASIEDSIDDYADFLTSNQRYKHALTEARDPAMYMNALQSAGYATDPHYAEKVMKLHESSHFKSLLIGLK